MRKIAPNATDQSMVIRIVDAAAGTPETGVIAATSGLSLSYRRELAAVVDLTESDLAALTTAHTDGGLLHIGAGYYRVDVPDAAFASGVPGVLIFGVVTDMVVIGEYVELETPQTGDSFARLGAPAGASHAVDVAAVKAETAAILEDTGTTVPAQITALENLSAAEVNAEVVDALTVDAHAEPGQGAPPATASIVTKQGYLYKAWRNRHTQTATEYALYADDATTKDQEAVVSSDGTTTERGEVGTGA